MSRTKKPKADTSLQSIWEYGNPNETYFKELNRIDSFVYYIPKDLIENTENELCNETRVAVFCYLYGHRILINDTISFSLKSMCGWFNKNDINPNSTILKKILDSLNLLSNMGYIQIKTNLMKYSIAKPIQVEFNVAVIKNVENGFAKIYNDELHTIFFNRRVNVKHGIQNLLLLSYLRCNIVQRPNKINHALNTHNLIEAYDCYEKDIINDIGLSHYYISNSIKDLMELGFIYCDRVSSFKYSEDYFIKGVLVFVNKYKREDKYVLAQGENYYMSEFKKKEMRLRQLFESYKKKWEIKSESD